MPTPDKPFNPKMPVKSSYRPPPKMLGVNVPAFALALLFLVLDFFIQKYFSKYSAIFLIELSIPILMILSFKIYRSANVAYTLELTEASEKPYCVVVYDVENADDLFVKGYREVPADGVLFSAEKLDDNLREIHLTGERIIGHGSFDGAITCSNKNYNYRAWFLVADRIRDYDGDSLTIEIKQFLQTQCEVIKRIEAGE